MYNYDMPVGFENFEYKEDLLPKDGTERKELLEKLKAQFIEELKSSEKVKAHLAKFNDNSTKDFIEKYAQKKVDMINHQIHYFMLLNEKEQYEVRYQKMAEKALEAILQKKLFNIQLKWAANSISIKKIETSYDFQYWEENIFNCPFIPLISQYDVDLMKQFLKQHDEKANIAFDIRGWQDRHELMFIDEDGDYPNMPEWYGFYDSRMGTTGLLLLPNIREELEGKYLSIRRESMRKDSTASAQINFDDRPYLHIYGEDLIHFYKVAETDKHFIRLFEAVEYDHYKGENQPDKDEIEEAIELFSLADRPIHFDSRLNWSEAIITAAVKYENKKTAEMLDFVYDNYCMMKELGLTHPLSERAEMNIKWAEDFQKRYRDMILDGRELNGEPRDFNF